MSLTSDALLDHLARVRILAIIRGDDVEATVRCVHTLAAAGLPLVEISLTGRGALEAIRRVAAEFGDEVALGAGTVLSAEDAHRARDAGARYCVTPALGPGVDTAIELGMPVLAGVHTATEVLAATRLGVTAAKLFPASTGGPEHLRALRAPFPHVPFVPVGGVGIEQATAYLAAGAVAVGAGSPLLGDAPAGGDQAALARRAGSFRAAAAAADAPGASTVSGTSTASGTSAASTASGPVAVPGTAPLPEPAAVPEAAAVPETAGQSTVDGQAGTR